LNTPLEQRFEDAKKLKEDGNSFYTKGVYKIALDLYNNALRRLKMDKKVRSLFHFSIFSPFLLYIFLTSLGD
jgi:hypothetical protein